MEVLNVVEEKKVSKYAKQIEYDRQRKLRDPEYLAKKRAYSNKSNKNRYQTDEEYNKKAKENAKNWNKKVREFYKEHKNEFPQKDKVD